MGNLGPAELILIMAIALIVFGPKKLPEIGKGLGNALREFNKARNDFMETLNSEMDRDGSYSSSRSSYSDTSQGEETVARPSGAQAALDCARTSEPEPEATPYGGDFYAVEGESQPAFRTAQPEHAPVTAAAHASAGYPAGSEGTGAGADGKA